MVSAVASVIRSRWFPLGLACGLLALGVPQTIDSVLWLQAHSSPDQIGDISTASPDAAAADARLMEAAGKRIWDARALLRAGVIRQRLAENRQGAARQAELVAAIDDLTNGLARAPGNSYAWTALAQARLAQGRPADAERAFATSLLIDDHNPELSLWRTQLGLSLWASLTPDDRRLWNDQVRQAWDYAPDSLVDLVSKGGSALFIRLALAGDRRRLAAFDKAFTAKR